MIPTVFLLHYGSRQWQACTVRLPPSQHWSNVANDCNYKGYASFVPHSRRLISAGLMSGCQLGEGFGLTAWQCELTRLWLSLYYLNKQHFSGPPTLFRLLFVEWWSVYERFHGQIEAWGHLVVCAVVVVVSEWWRRFWFFHHSVFFFFFFHSMSGRVRRLMDSHCLNLLIAIGSFCLCF